MTRVTPNFTLDELRCRCGCILPEDVLANLSKLAEALEVVRADLKKPVSVISGYRCPSHNKKVKGTPSSRHIKGDACDLQVEGFSGTELRTVFERLIRDRKIPQGGLGTYADRPRTLHYDLRGRRARWAEPGS